MSARTRRNTRKFKSEYPTFLEHVERRGGRPWDESEPEMADTETDSSESGTSVEKKGEHGEAVSDAV